MASKAADILSLISRLRARRLRQHIADDRAYNLLKFGEYRRLRGRAYCPNRNFRGKHRGELPVK
jgi:hypothetical protein